MRTSVLSVLLCLISFFNAHPKNEVNYDYSTSRMEVRYYVDNLGSVWLYYPLLSPYLKSEIFIEAYYSKLKDSDYIEDIKRNFRLYPVDFTARNKKCHLHLYSKKAKSGYLYINECVTSKIAEMGHDFKGLKTIQKSPVYPSLDIFGKPAKLQYIFNGRIVRTKDDVKKVLKLKKEQVEVLYVIYNEYINTYIVSFVKK